MKKLLFLFSLLFLYNVTSKGQNTANQELRMPQINVKNLRAEESPVIISQVDANVKVVGSLAVTTIEMLISNPNNRLLEGELEFPLSEGQSISRLALDINGKLREGVAVDKAKGQATFESIARRNVDPALLEKTVGNNFKLRVYPIPARGTRRVVIAYEQELDKKNDCYRFVLPVEYGNTLDKFNLNLTIYGSPTTPSVDQTPWGTFNFDHQGDAYLANYTTTNYKAKGQLVFSVPIKRENNTYIERGKISNENIFFSKVFPKPINEQKVLPQAIDLYWDISGSMSKRNNSLEFDLLDNYFSAIRNLTVNLNTFNISVQKTEKYEIKNGDWSQLKAALEKQNYDGATQYGVIDLTKSKADEIFFLSDGISNLGKSEIKLGTQPVVVINSSMINDDSNLKYLSVVSGGQFINLLNQTPTEAVANLKKQNYRLISIDYNQNQICGLTNSGSKIDIESGFFVAGKLLSSRATIILKFGVGNRVLDTQKIELNAQQTGNYENIVERVWAAKRIEELDLRYEKNKEEIGFLGKTYNVVTRNTSLIVLENVEDYIQYDITPPEELREQYEQLISRRGKEQTAVKENTINWITSLVNIRKNWWDKTFSYKPITEKTFTDRPLVNSPGRVNGVVVDAAGEALPGVSISVRNTNKGAVTDIDGRFTIDAQRGDVLIVSYIGYVSKQITVSDLSLGNIILDESEVQFDEVITTAYGVQRNESPSEDREYMAIQNVEINRLQDEIQQRPEAPADMLVEANPNGDWFFGLGASASYSDDIDSEGFLDRRTSSLASSLASMSTGLSVSSEADARKEVADFSAKRSVQTEEPRVAQKTVSLKTWTPNAPYMNQLKSVSDKDLYTTYLSLKEEYAITPSFYFDVATVFEERGLKEEAFLVLSNVAELDLQNYKLIRVLAHRLLQLGYTDYAIGLFEKVLELRPEEPQSYRDLALALEQDKQYQKSIDLFNEALAKTWDSRFREIEIILIEEMNHAIFSAKQNKVKVNISAIDQRFIADMPVDIRIVLNWDTDNSDMDLWVTDPAGEKCYYQNKNTKIGGMISADFTGGYGPEEYLIKKAVEGKYKIQANYFGSREQTLVGPTTIYLDIFTNYGKSNEKKQTIMLRLSQNKETISIGEVTW